MKRKIPNLSELEKYKILIKPVLCDADIMLLNACGKGAAKEIRNKCINETVREGLMPLTHLRVNTWIYMKLLGINYEHFERIPEVLKWKREQMQ